MALAPDAVVIRGGEMRLQGLLLAMLRCKAEETRRGVDPPHLRLSVVSFPDKAADEVAALAGLPHPTYCASTARAIEAAGWTVEPTPGARNGHCDLYLGEGLQDPDTFQLIELRSAFTRPIINPTPRRGG